MEKITPTLQPVYELRYLAFKGTKPLTKRQQKKHNNVLKTNDKYISPQTK